MKRRESSTHGKNSFLRSKSSTTGPLRSMGQRPEGKIEPRTKTPDFRVSETRGTQVNRDSKSVIRVQSKQMVPGLLPSRGLNFGGARGSVFDLGGGMSVLAWNSIAGLIRPYNEDRVSIMAEVRRPSKYKGRRFPQCSVFGVFDGHGGAACAEFLATTLAHRVVEHPAFPEDVGRALGEGFAAVEAEFIARALRPGGVDRSGSCAVLLVLIESTVFVANVGDSRAILSRGRGRNAISLTRDHKPGDPAEKLRIERNGGTVAKSPIADKDPEAPLRVYPGGLSVSRAFGDVTAKDPRLGGNPNILTAKPEISTIRLDSEADFIVLACDGVFDKLSTQRVVETIWTTLDSEKRPASQEQRVRLAEKAADSVIRESLNVQSFDNLTSIFININAI